MDSAGYARKLARMEATTLLPTLPAAEAEYIRRLAGSYRFTYQELRQVCQAARDLEMWGESPLERWWTRSEGFASGAGRQRKKSLLSELARHMARVAAGDKEYPAEGFTDLPRRRVTLQAAVTGRKILGPCPAYSEETVCCGLHTLDAVRGCPFSCSYCTIQTFYGETAELEADLASKLSRLELDPERRYHIGTGQASDSLVWGNREGILDSLLGFAGDHPNVLLELKSKSGNVAPLSRRQVPPNVVCSWTLNTSSIIRNEEKGAASLEQRLRAARVMADRGVAVAFHFHPMVLYRGWDAEYSELAARVLERFVPEEISFISMGTVTLIKPVIQEIRRRGGKTKILQMEMVQDHHGKLTYPDPVKLQLFTALYQAFSPWHARVLFYLCMETASIWHQVLGHAYASNEDFEKDFLERCLPSPPASSSLRGRSATLRP